MTTRRKVELIFWMITLGAAPAWANNPPQPDGLFSLILIFPVAIIGFRLAGAVYSERQRKWRVARGLLLGLAVLLTAGGTELALVPLVVILVFGCMRGIQIMQRGQGRKRIWIGAAVCLWTLFALSDYFVSLAGYPLGAVNEASAVAMLRTLATAEDSFSQEASKTKATKFGQLDDLVAAGLIDKDHWPDRGGYRFAVSLSDGGKGFVASAVPLVFGERERMAAMIPGESWFRQLGGGRPKATGSRNFAVDDSGVIRFNTVQLLRPPTREEAEKWKPLD